MFCNGTENAIVNRSITIITKQRQKKGDKKYLDTAVPLSGKKNALPNYLAAFCFSSVKEMEF